MKRLVFSLSIFLAFVAAKAQTKYAFVYAYSSADKTIYVSPSVNLDNYSNCSDDNGYNSKILPEKCLEKAFVKSVKIEAGSKYRSFTFKVRACKYENSGYNCSEIFNDASEAADAARDVISRYREMGYSYVKLSLD